MIITVAALKGGVGKTTTAFHLCAYWAQKGLDCVLIDGDPNHSALGWAASSGNELPFAVIDQLDQAGFFMSRTKPPDRIVVDTQARPSLDDLRSLTRSTRLLIIPTTPDALSLRTLPAFLGDLAQLPPVPYRVLVADMPPKPSTDGPDAISYLQRQQIPVFGRGVRHYSAFKKAALAGVPVHQIREANAARGWEDYCAIAQEIDNALKV